MTRPFHQRPQLTRHATARRGTIRRTLLPLLVLWFALGQVVGLRALDEVVLRSGRVYLGTIIEDTPERLVLSIDGGTVAIPRANVISPPYAGPVAPPPTPSATHSRSDDIAETVSQKHPLPDITTALRRLRTFTWATDLRQIPVLVTDQGRWQYLPGIAFRAGSVCLLTVYGDPGRPAAIEVSLEVPPGDDAWDKKQRVLEYILSLAPELAIDSRFDQLDLDGDSFAVGDIWIEVTTSDRSRTPARWSVVLMHEPSLKPARATLAELEVISEPVADIAIISRRTAGRARTVWTREDIELMRKVSGRQMDDAASRKRAWTALGGGERVYVRAFTRRNGRYARADIDWIRELAAVASQ